MSTVFIVFIVLFHFKFGAQVKKVSAVKSFAFLLLVTYFTLNLY